MNLKEAFRFQNKLSSLMEEVENIIRIPTNITKVQSTLQCSKVVKGTQDIVSYAVPATDYAEQITELTSFLMFLLGEKEKLYSEVQKTKATLDIDIDSETAMNAKRQEIASYFKSMNDIRSSEKLLVGEGVGYTFNTDGNQVPFKCDLKKVTTINFDRNKIRAYLEKLHKISDSVSEKLDIALVTSNVAYEAPFDVNASLNDIFENFMQTE